MSKIKVSKIEIEIDGKTIKVTPKQARELRNALDDVLGKDVKVIEKERHYPYPYWPRITYFESTNKSAEPNWINWPAITTSNTFGSDSAYCAKITLSNAAS